MASKREFSVQSAYRYDQRSALRWIWSHIWRYKRFFITTVACFITAWLVYSRAQLMIGKAAAQLLNRGDGSALLAIALTILGLLIADGLSMLVGSLSAENIASRISTDAREELYISLLGKSQTFHDRQRVGDLMARATDDVSQLGSMIVPGGTLIFEAILGIAVPLATIATLRLELLIVPLGFVICYIITVRRYMRRLNPVARRQREQFGRLNAGLEETISEVEVVKASARELFEGQKFRANARLFRDLFVQQTRTWVGTRGRSKVRLPSSTSLMRTTTGRTCPAPWTRKRDRQGAI